MKRLNLVKSQVLLSNSPSHHLDGICGACPCEPETEERRVISFISKPFK